jgi:zinc transporter ZupT
VATVVVTAGVAAVLLAVVHVVARRFEEALSVVPRSRWLSIGGGVSVAYVFVHLLPELAAAQAELEETGAIAAGVRHELWVGALAGLVVIYGLERLAGERGDQDADDGDGEATTWVHLGSYALYNAIAGFLLLEQAEQGPLRLALYTTAIAVHFLVNDHGLVERHGDVYRAVGRWLLAGAILAGWLASLVGVPGEATVPLLLGFLAGGIVLNVLKEELPEQRRSRFGTFAVAAVAYAALLLAV